VPKDRGVVAGLNLEENLLLPPIVQRGGLGIDENYYSAIDNGLRGERLRSQTGGELRLGITFAFGRCQTERRE